jgi:hypothetical protein
MISKLEVGDLDLDISEFDIVESRMYLNYWK